MQTIEIDKQVFEDMLRSMTFLHKLVNRLWKNLHPPLGSGKWLTPYAAANALGITVRSLQSLKAAGKIGYFQEPGGNCLYSEEEVGQFLLDNRMEADGNYD